MKDRGGRSGRGPTTEQAADLVCNVTMVTLDTQPPRYVISTHRRPTALAEISGCQRPAILLRELSRARARGRAGAPRVGV